MNVRKAQALMRASMIGAAAETSGGAAAAAVLDKEIKSFALDSRTVEAGALFFALSPDDYRRHCFTATTFDDAHRFISHAMERGAVAAVARRERIKADQALQSLSDRLILVDDVIDALQSLARGVFEEWGRPVIALTGSAGKTTTKDLTAHVLTVAGRRVLKSQKNFNNELGVPLSMLQMVSDGRQPHQFDAAVIEMGMSMPGELKRLSRVAVPDIAVELCVLPVHLEFLETIERIAAAKSELIENLKPEGTAILNADDKYVSRMRDKHLGRTLTFGIENAADVTATNIGTKQLSNSFVTSFRLRTPQGDADAELPMPGRHNLMNALAAAAVATCFGIEAATIAEALKTALPSEMRGEVLRFTNPIGNRISGQTNDNRSEISGFTVVDDSYNSNPRALVQMVQTIAEQPSPQHDDATMRRIVLAGEMLELGAASREMHRDAGKQLAELGIDVVWGVRGHAEEIVRGAREAGMNENAVRFFETSDAAAKALVDEARAGDLILVKGSRGVHMERIIEGLRQEFKRN